MVLLDDARRAGATSPCTLEYMYDVSSARRHLERPRSLRPGSLRAATFHPDKAQQLFYQDSYAQHLKQDWLVKALNIPEASRFEIEHIAEMFNTATGDFWSYSQQHGIAGMPLSKYTLATCTVLRLLLMSQKPEVQLGVCG